MRDRSKTNTHPFGPPRRPVILPVDAARPSMRAVATTVAIGMLLVGIVTGVVYHRTWEGKSHDATRLLPASTQAYARVAHPWASLRDALLLERWRDPVALDVGLEADGLLAARMSDRVAGIPLATVRHILAAVDAVQLAVVPTPDGVGVLAFLEVEDPWERRRISARLMPWTEPVDRQLGYDIRALSHPGELLPWTQPPLPIRLAAIDPHLVLSFGPEAALSDLIHAKVSGRSQPIRSRDGFRPPEAQAEGELWAFFDPASAWDALARERQARPRDLAWRRALMASGVRAITGHADLGDGHETLELTARLSPSGVLQRLPEAFEGAAGELLELAPPDALLVADVALGAPQTIAAVLRDVVERLRAELEDEAYEDAPASAWLQRGLDLLDRLDAGELAALAGEALLAVLPGDAPDPLAAPTWVFVARVRAPSAVERAVDRLLPTLARGDFAHGRLARGDHDLHLVRPVTEDDDGAPPTEILAWRVRGDRLEVAPNRATLDVLDRAGAADAADERAALLTEARRVGRGNSAALFVVHPAAVAALGGPMAEQLNRRLRDGFRLVVTVGGAQHALVVRSNLGPWTAGLSVAASTRSEIDELVLRDLSPGCRAAVDAFCDEWPTGLACHPLDPGRAGRIRAACRRLGL